VSGLDWRRTVERHEEIFSLFEGKCPACELPPEPMSVGGKRQFFVDQSIATTVNTEVRVWNEDEREGSEVIGSVTFRCRNMHEYTVEYSRWGEWQ
jgi:hypothetical protein